MRRNVVGALASMCVLALGVSACGGSSSEVSTSANRGRIGGVVKVWDTEYQSLPGYTKAIDQIDAEFEKLHRGVKIKREAQPLENLESLLRAAFTAREGPDAIVLQPGMAGVLSYTKGLEALNHQIDGKLQGELTQWASATPGFSEEGQHYGVPIGLVGLIYYYNKALFAKAGLPRDFAPKSWAEVRQAGEKLKAAGIQPFVGGDKEGFENQWWLSMGYETEVTEAQRDELAKGTLKWTDKAVADAFGPLFEMQKAGLYPARRFSQGFIEGCAEFAQGKGAMVLGFWNTACHWGEFDPKLGEQNVGFFTAPGSSSATPYANFVMSIPTFAKNKAAALALIEFEASRKSMQKLVDVGSFMPNRSDVSLPSSFPKQARELVQLAQRSEGKTTPDIMIPSAVGFGPMATGINAALQGHMTLADAQKEMQETAEKSGR